MSKKGRTRSADRRTRARGQASGADFRESFWDRQPVSRQHFICILILAASALMMFVPHHLAGKAFLGHDVVQWRAGHESIAEAREVYGEEPLWAQNMFGGMPATVISHARQFPSIDTVVRHGMRFIYPVAEYWIMLIGAYMLFVLLGFRPLYAVIGSAIIGFTTYIPIIVGAGHETKFWSYAYVQWVAVGYVMVTRKPAWRLVGLAIFVLALSLHLRQSHPQVTYYFLYLFVAWVIFDLVRAYRAKDLRPMGIATAMLAGAAFLAALTVLQPYWAIMEYSPFSIRGASDIEAGGGLDIDYAFVWSQGWAELLTLLIPNLFGGAEYYWGPKPMTSGPHYFGAIGFLLFVVGLIRARHPLKWLFFGVGTLAILFSLGRHFAAFNELMFGLMPGFDKFRTPEMWLILTVFCFALIAVAGLHWIVTDVREKGGRATMRALYLPLGIAAAITILTAILAPAMMSFQKPGEREAFAQQVATQAGVEPSDPRAMQAADQFIQGELVPERRSMASSDAVRFVLFVGFGICIIALGVTAKIPMSIAVMALVAATLVDMMTVGTRYMTHALPQRGADPITLIEAQASEVDRYLQEAVRTEEGWSYRVFPLAQNPFNNAIPAYFYPTIGGYSGAKMGAFQDLIDHAIFSGPMGLNVPVLSMLNVRYISHVQPIQLPGFRQAHATERGVVMENMNVMPKAFFVDSLVTVGRPIDALEFVAEGTFDPAEIAVVETSDALTSSSDAQSDARVTTYRPRLIEIETSRSVDGFLVLSENYYPPGWSAELNGNEVPIYKTNYVLRGIPVPAGEHVVRLTFDPPSYAIGQPVTTAAHILMWLSIIAMIGLTYRRRRSLPPTSPMVEEGLPA